MITHFRGNLAAALETGHVLVIGGKTIDGAREHARAPDYINFHNQLVRFNEPLRSFEVALTGGKVSEADVQLGVSVQFGEDCIVRNTKTAGHWGEDEREENLNDFTTTNPIVPGERFKIYVLIGDAGFIISVDDQPFCTYEFRLPIEDIRTLVVQGDLQSITQIDHRRVFPLARPLVMFDDPRAEFSNDVPVPFTVGHIIVLTAMPYGHPSGWFEIRFTEGASMRQLFHFNVRFGTRPSVVRNAQNEELRWNYTLEERDGECPFAVDEQFTMAVALTGREFLVAVNGTEYCTFTYKMKNQLQHMNGLKVVGSHGGHLEVTAVDHITGGPADCAAYERYSEPGVKIL